MSKNILYAQIYIKTFALDNQTTRHLNSRTVTQRRETVLHTAGVSCTLTDVRRPMPRMTDRVYAFYINT